MKISKCFIWGSVAFFALETSLFMFVDQPLSQWLRTVDIQQHALVDFFRSITDFGKSKWYLIPSAIGVVICILILRLKAFTPLARARARIVCGQLLFLFICGSVAGILTDIIKPILGRARPVELESDNLYGFHPLTFAARWNSMPSGHATSVFAFALVMSGFFPRLRIPFFLLALFLAFSRVMVNAHYLSDVLAGMAVAYLCVTVLRGPFVENGIFHIYKRIFLANK